MLIDTFRENCAKKRIDFFKDPLVKYLWNKIFMQEKPEVFLDHLRWMRSDPKYGDIAISKFVLSLRMLEDCHISFTHNGSNVEVDSIKKFN